MGLLDRLKRKMKKEDVSKKDNAVAFGKAEKPFVRQSADQGKKEIGEKTVVLLSPIISEKSAGSEALGIYAFRVDSRANKYNIKKAVKDIYGVIPKKVRVLNLEGKKTRFGYKEGRRSDWKKAIITMPAGQKLNIHEGV